MPRLNCTQVNSLTKDKFLIVWVLSSSLSSLFLWFSVSVFFFFSHSSVLGDDHWTINWKRHKKELKQWMMFSFLSLWQQYGKQDGFYSFCPARAYTMLWFGHFHHSWQMEWKNKASLKKWMNKWWVSVKNKDSVDIYSWCTVIGSLCRYHHLKGIKGTKQ